MESVNQLIQIPQDTKTNIMVFIISWIALLGVSLICGKQIRETFSWNTYLVQRALWIAVILDLIVTVGIFQQSLIKSIESQ